MSETKSAKNSLRAEAKDYEAVQMLNTEINEKTVDEKRRTKKDDEKQVTVRQVFKLTHSCARSYLICISTWVLLENFDQFFDSKIDCLLGIQLDDFACSFHCFVCLCFQ